MPSANLSTVVLSAELGFGVYIHWPFCVSKCPYCDFNSHVRDAVDHERWRKALLRELEYYASLTPGRQVTSIFFGGGTPSLMQPETVAAVIGAVRTLWDVVPDLEITAEANPGSVDQAVFEGFAKAGVNRVSIGVQAFDTNALKFLGRQHNAEDAHRAIKLAAQHFPRFSFDLIYARPGQTVSAWQDELQQALAYGPAHLSAYQLTIEEGTKFENLHRHGAFILPDEDLAADLYEITNKLLDEAGLLPYEISNYARPGQESRHNLTYWRYEDYIGVGPGAHGRLTLVQEKYATRAHRAPEIWLERVETTGHGAHEPVLLKARDRFEELLMMGLRLTESIPLARIESESGKSLQEWISPSVLSGLQKAGYIAVDGQGIATTVAGRQRLNAVLQRLITT